MPATVATPAERRKGWTGPVTRSMNSGQWSIASSRPLPSLSSAKSFVPKPLAFVLPASSSRSLKDTVDDLSVVAFRKSKCTASSWLHGLLIRPSVAKGVQLPNRLADGYLIAPYNAPVGRDEGDDTAEVDVFGVSDPEVYLEIAGRFRLGACQGKRKRGLEICAGLVRACENEQKRQHSCYHSPQ